MSVSWETAQWALGLLLGAVVLVNGWTDAPNAIATVVASGTLSFRRAAALAAVCNLLGTTAAARWLPTVTRTVGESVNLTGADAQTALCAALAATALWAVLAWRFGIPTSESHALLAGLAGAALALPGEGNLRPQPWGKAALGLVLSLALGAALGRWAERTLERRNWGEAACRRGQLAGAAGMAFLHGAQDGQKFLGLFLLLGGGGGGTVPPIWAVLCGLTMALGTLLGGRRIVEHVGRDLVALSPRSGLAADVGGGAALGLCTVLGLPVSTTHAKTAAIWGAGTAGGQRASARTAGGLLLAWGLTFPVCAALGFLLVRVML